MPSATVCFGSRRYARLLSSLRGAPGGIVLIHAESAATIEERAADLAAALDRPLQRVDLARVIGEHIGETERNLARVLEAAERAGAVLLFDEADALFGKRTEVSNAHDRYAALEAERIIEGMRAFPGLCVLAAPTDPVELRDLRGAARAVVRLPWRGRPRVQADRRTPVGPSRSAGRR